MRSFAVITMASLATAGVGVNACGGTSNEAPTAGALDASVESSVDGAIDAASDAAIGRCGPFADPDPAGAVCSRAEAAMRWAVMRTLPIVPPFRAAGLDLRGPHGVGLTLAEAEHTLCASPDAGRSDGGVAGTSWGESDEVLFHISRGDAGVTRFLALTKRYAGAIDFASSGRQHTYRVAIGEQLTRDGAPFVLDWSSPSHLLAIDEILGAMMATFTPNEPLPPSPICTWTMSPSPSTKHCILGSYGNTAYFHFPLVGVAVFINDKSAAQPGPSTPVRIDLSGPSKPCDAP